MLEIRSGYFEAVRYCMVGLQHVADTNTPLDKYQWTGANPRQYTKTDLVIRKELRRQDLGGKSVKVTKVLYTSTGNKGCCVSGWPDSALSLQQMLAYTRT
ncbi:hypothetical protein CHU98_g11489 [Xylaria longipes]|nr:hypothetical protein CHU98_g11489 [Xylaria longipes]